MEKTSGITGNKCWKGCEGKGNPHSLWVGLPTTAATMEISVENPQKAKINHPQDSATPLHLIDPTPQILAQPR